jgi:hypothetical protein
MTDPGILRVRHRSTILRVVAALLGALALS